MVLQGTLAVCSTLAALVVGYPHLPVRNRQVKVAQRRCQFFRGGGKARPCIVSAEAGPPLTLAISFPQPVVQCAESGPRIHRPGDSGDA